MNLTESNFKQRACAICGAVNGGAKRWLIHFSYNRKAYVCRPCIERLGGTPAIMLWLENHAVFSKPNGKLAGFKEGEPA